MAPRRFAPSLAALAVIAGLATPQPAPAQQAGGSRISNQDTFTASHVLTPGEVDDWPLAARDGETVVLAVTSDQFDPAVVLVDSAGKTVAPNDDVRPGQPA